MEPPSPAESNLEVVLHILGTAYAALDAISMTREPATAEALRESARALHEAALKFAMFAKLDELERRSFNAAVTALEQKLVATGAWPSGRKG